MATTGPDESARDVFGRRAAFYTTSPSHTDAAVLARLVELAAPQPSWLAVDVGTGTGHTAFAVAPHVRLAVGVDPTPEMLHEALGLKAKQSIANVEVCLGLAEALPFATGAVDLITCRRAAHHFGDVAAAAAEMHRVLRPGGRLLLDDRSVPEDDFVDECMNRLDWYHDHSHVAEYRPSAWSDMLERAGFALNAVETYTRHRPLSSLTEGASPEDVASIHALLARLGPDERRRLNLVGSGETIETDHWFVMVAATKQ
jgi:ubiquinone/menaquinone biosynthesis C-methylase UbiE